jgi:hypothetical protein
MLPLKANPQMAHSGSIIAIMNPTRDIKPIGEKRFTSANCGKPIDHWLAGDVIVKVGVSKPDKLNDGVMFDKKWFNALTCPLIKIGIGVGVGVIEAI